MLKELSRLPKQTKPPRPKWTKTRRHMLKSLGRAHEFGEAYPIGEGEKAKLLNWPNEAPKGIW